MSPHAYRHRGHRRKGKPGGSSTGGQPADSGPSAQAARQRGARQQGALDRESPRAPARPTARETPREAPAPRPPARPAPPCPVCGQPVRELSSALTHRASGAPAHFDCILKELRETLVLEPQERLCYLGGGAFGVIVLRTEGNPAAYTIKRRIPYEEPDKPAPWKKELQIGV